MFMIETESRTGSPTNRHGRMMQSWVDWKAKASETLESLHNPADMISTWEKPETILNWKNQCCNCS